MDRVGQFFGDGPKEPALGDKIHETNLKLRQYQKDYLDYWNATTSRTTTGRPVDAVLCPVAPTPAFQLGKAASVCECFTLFRCGRSVTDQVAVYTPWVNILDYTSVVVPVSKVQVAIDKCEENYESISDMDSAIHDECKCYRWSPPKMAC